MDECLLEELYQERLAERLIGYLAEKYGMDYQRAMDVYYRSALAAKIHEGKYGVQYLDHKVLADILVETEPELLRTGAEKAE